MLPVEQDGARNTAHGLALVGMAREPDLKAECTGIGAALRTLYANVLREEFPDRVAELLTQLDQQKDADNRERP